MTLRIQCVTKFDIAVTGIRGNPNRNRMPFHDATGTLISTVEAWHSARNRQRNWETINQIISLRTLPIDITTSQPTNIAGQPWWKFEFTVEQPASVELNGHALGALNADCVDVPMLLGLDESAGLNNVLIPGSNIIFELVSYK